MPTKTLDEAWFEMCEAEKIALLNKKAKIEKAKKVLFSRYNTVLTMLAKEKEDGKHNISK